jgi:uncharacterized protein YbcV (DUF1398 family)
LFVFLIACFHTNIAHTNVYRVKKGISCTNAEGEKRLREEHDEKISEMIKSEMAVLNIQPPLSNTETVAVVGGGDNTANVSSSSAAVSSSTTTTTTTTTAYVKKNDNPVLLDGEEEHKVAEQALDQLKDFITNLTSLRENQVLHICIYGQSVSLSHKVPTYNYTFKLNKLNNFKI